MRRRKFIEVSALLPVVAQSESSLRRMTLVDQERIQEEKRTLPVVDAFDVIVCGGGPAGVSAAIEAGRQGAKTLLVEVHGCLGGVWTAGNLTWILDQVNKAGLMREIETRLLDHGGISRDVDTGDIISFDAEIMKWLLEDLCTSANVQMCYHTRVVATNKDEHNRLTHIITESKSGREAWAGKLFIDCTGDGDLAALSGCNFDLGQPSNQALQPFSMLALIGGIQFNQIREFSRYAGDHKSGSKKRLLQEIIKGAVIPSYTRPGLYPIRKNLFMLMANHEYGYSPLDARAVTKATVHARKEVHAIIKALRSNGGVWSDIHVIATPEQIGTREGRRIHGLYKVTEQDLVKGAHFDDAVCRVTFPVDVHAVSKVQEVEGSGYSRGVKSKDYDIPMRSLIAKDVAGLMMAGRCISGDFIAHSSYRVTGNAVTMGQAAGRASAIAARKRLLPQELAFRELGLTD
ncbi:MAG: FAD-dependent oxidoreductase [Saprospiraceae bacterium]|nr:FAD-dependent oxidoreductase [Saprospiraceae bacterium]